MFRRYSIFALLVVVLMATACTPAATSTPVETVVSETVPVPATATPGPTATAQQVTIVLQEPWSLDSDRGKVIQGLVSDFMADNPDIRVVIKDTGVKNEVFITEVLSNSAADVIMFGEDGVATFGPQDAFLDLAPYVAQWDETKRNDFFESVWQFGTYEDKQYGVPWIAHSMQLIYNRDMFREAGLDPDNPPKTWDELFAAAQALTKGDQYGFALVGKQGHDMAWSWYNFVWQSGGELATQENGQWQIDLNSPEALEALNFYIKLKDVAPPESTSTGGGEAEALFIQKRVAMFVLGPWNVASVRKNAPDIDVGVAPLPYSKQPGTTVGAGILTIPRTSQNPEAAWRLIDFLTEVDSQVKLVSGGFAFRIPTRQSATQDPWFQENPEYIPFVEGLSYGHPPTVIPIAQKYNQAHNEVIQPELSRAFIGEETPEEALANMEKNGNILIQ